MPVRAVLTSSDPADACGRFVTKRYLRVAYGGRQGCVDAQAPGSAARSFRYVRVDIDDVAMNGGALFSYLTVVPVGGPYDGEEVEVTLKAYVGDSRREFRRWRVFALEANVPVGP